MHSRGINSDLNVQKKKKKKEYFIYIYEKKEKKKLLFHDCYDEKGIVNRVDCCGSGWKSLS